MNLPKHAKYRTEIENILDRLIREVGVYGSPPPDRKFAEQAAKDLLDIFDKYADKIIGQDEPTESMFTDMNVPKRLRNVLKDEQRHRKKELLK